MAGRGDFDAAPSAISGSTPIVTNSVVPIAKPPTAGDHGHDAQRAPVVPGGRTVGG